MITGIVCIIGGIFFQKFFPFFGDIVVEKVQAGVKYVVGLFGKKDDEAK